MEYNVTDGIGNVVTAGSEITDFRGDTFTFVKVDRLATPGKSAKVTVKDASGAYAGPYNAEVFSLTVAGR